MRSLIALALATLVPLAACAAGGARIHAPPDEGRAESGTDQDDGAVRVVPYDQPFELPHGQRVQVERTDTRARFVGVVEDSRCPAGVECIQAGRARVRLEVVRGGDTPVSIELATDPDRNLASAGGVTWELQGVSPSPVAGEGQRPATDYVITLAVRPLR
jgi:hypothetical protein